MIEGPYSSSKWRDRLRSIEGALEILQVIVVLALACVVGYELLSGAQYLKFVFVFGGGVLASVLFWITRSPLFLLALVPVFALGVWL